MAYEDKDKDVTMFIERLHVDEMHVPKYEPTNEAYTG
jgi:hypothetical protein